MRKTIMIGLMTLLSLTLVYGFSDAKVSGPCVNCHTMHFSQGGTDIIPSSWLLTGEPRGALTANTCLGCHTTSGSEPRPSLAGGGYALYVRSTTSGAFTDNNCLAGGFFPNGIDDDGNANSGKAHSIRQINETASTATPPGYNSDWYVKSLGLTCAGSSGCHGLQNVADESDAIKGGHHASSTDIGYRILKVYGGAKVVGTGADDYEKALIAAVTTEPAGDITRTGTSYAHNIYSAGSGTNTISKFCANCHGDFHVSSGTTWQRHPTDIELTDNMLIKEDTVVTDYDAKYNPFGFTDVSSTAGTKHVTCLSCHRAHGTGKYDLVRFNYNPSDTAATKQSANSGNQFGCLACHSDQR